MRFVIRLSILSREPSERANVRMKAVRYDLLKSSESSAGAGAISHELAAGCCYGFLFDVFEYLKEDDKPPAADVFEALGSELADAS